jgi:hypothetical protein
VVVGGEEVVGKLQGGVGKLEVESIEVEEGRRNGFDEDRGSPAKGSRRRGRSGGWDAGGQ